VVELRDALRTTAAVRSFTDEPVAPEVVHAILDDARFAPSGGNQQGWRVAVVDDRSLRRRLADLSAPVWARYLAEQAAGHRAFSVVEPAPTDLAIPEGLPAHPMLAAIEQVPVVLVVAVDLRCLAVTDRDLERPSIIGGGSIYPFVHNLLLAARGRGLGGVITTFLAAAEREAAPLLGLPDHHAIVAMIGLGHPTHQPTRLRRRPVEAFATVDRFDGEPFAP
jgi:nitroreductase